MTFFENISTKIYPSYDVIVAGGGIAGIAAALSARRQGASVLLIENSFVLGGLATSGIVTIYLPLCDGCGRQVSFGICEELIKLSAKHFTEDASPNPWLFGGSEEEKKERRFEIQFNPHMFAIEAEKLLTEEGVKILYGTKICNVVKENDRITHIICENKSGRCAYPCKAAIDCTGDADLFNFAGLPCDTFNAGNVLAAWYYFFSKGTVNLKMLGYAEDPDNPGGGNPLVSRRFSGLDAEDTSEMMVLAHKNILNDVLNHRKDDDTYVPTNIASIPQLRMTRKPVGEYVLDESEEHKYFESSIGLISNWKKRGPVYEVPFETLYCKECSNLFAAGRCISVTEKMWDISRVIPPCAVTGEAAGIAAVLSIDSKQVAVKDVQAELLKNGVILHERDLKG